MTEQVTEQVTFTLRLIACIQHWMILLDLANGRQTKLWPRLERAETYLIRRYNRADTPEEADAFETIWGRFDMGGEG